MFFPYIYLTLRFKQRFSEKKQQLNVMTVNIAMSNSGMRFQKPRITVRNRLKRHFVASKQNIRLRQLVGRKSE